MFHFIFVSVLQYIFISIEIRAVRILEEKTLE